MEAEGPYTYPLTDRADIEAWLGEHTAYSGCLAWNIKVHYRFDTSGAAYRDEFKFEPRFDEAWKQEIEDDNDLFDIACEDATRMYVEGDWTRYPGVEQGEYKFGISGRSGGWMLLEDWPGPKPVWIDRDDFQCWLQDLDDETLNKFYQVIVQLDHDLSRDACRKEMEYRYAFRRSVWEDEQLDAEENAAREIGASRPDMYSHQEDDGC